MSHVFVENRENVVISPFHDIPLFADKDKQILNMVVEIPRWSNAKMEVCLQYMYHCCCFAFNAYSNLN